MRPSRERSVFLDIAIMKRRELRMYCGWVGGISENHRLFVIERRHATNARIKIKLSCVPASHVITDTLVFHLIVVIHAASLLLPVCRVQCSALCKDTRRTRGENKAIRHVTLKNHRERKRCQANRLEALHVRQGVSVKACRVVNNVKQCVRS